MGTTDILYNTPGYYYSIAYTIAAIMIVVTHHKRLSNRWLAAASCLFFAGLLGFMTLTSGIERAGYVFSMLLIFAWIVFYIYICGDFSLREAVIHCARAVINGELAASLSWQIFYYSSETILKGMIWRWTEMIIVYAALFTGVYFLERRMSAGSMRMTVKIHELISVLLLFLTVYVVSNLSYLNSETLFSGGAVMDIFIIRTLVDLSGAAMLYAWLSQMREFHLRMENEKLNYLVQMQWTQYQMSLRNAAVVNRKYHDMKHFITVLETEKQPEKIEEYLKGWKQEIKRYETQNNTGNQILDVVLSEQYTRCQENGIEFKYMVDGKAASFIDDVDLSVLFGNILDNAVECVSAQAGPQRTIRLYAAEEKQFLRLLEENVCEEELQFQEGLPLTSKKDKENHGYGLKSIRTIVEKYGGSVLAEQENGMFRLKILIPLRKKSDTGEK